MTADEIKATVNIIDVIHSYGFAVDRKNNMVCPFHKEKTGSLKVYPENNSWHCFGCGAGNDVIDFVMKMENITFPQAIKRLGGEDVSQKQKEVIRQRKLLQKQLEKERKQIESDYIRALDEYVRLDRNFIEYSPKNQQEPLHPLFIEALQHIEYQKYLLDKAEERQWNFEHRNPDGNFNT